MLKFCSSTIKEDMAIICAQLKDKAKFYNKSVLITGATGMLATYCIYFFMYLNDNYDANIMIFGLARNKEKADKRFEDILDKKIFQLLYQDIADPINIENKIDYIFHMAGSASAYAIVNDPIGIIMANVIGTGNVMQLAENSPGCRVVFASTREVYGTLDSSVTLITEDMVGILDQMQSRSCYPESKRMAENICVNYGKMQQTDSVIARIAHAYGPGMAFNNDGRIMADLMGNAVSGQDIVLKSDGSTLRAFCYVGDAVSAILLLATHGMSGEVYNIANETEEISIKDLAFLIAGSISGKKLNVTYRQMTEQERAGYLKTQRICLSTKKLELLGWRPTTSLNDGIERTLSIHCSN